MMLTKHKLVLLFLIGVNIIFDLNAQFYLNKYREQAKKLPFHEYARIINQEYDSLSLPQKGAYKIWKRLEWWASMHLGEDGKVAPYALLNQEAAQQIKRMPNYLNERSNAGTWINIGYSAVDNGGDVPRLGRVNCFVVSPVNTNIIFAGAACGGIWKSQDGGNSWFCTTESFPTMSISGLTISNDGTTLYALSGDGFASNVYNHSGMGIFKSTDGGLNWKNVYGYNIALGYGGYKIHINPNNENEIFAATNFGLLHSTDGGVNWSNLTINANITDFEIKPNDSNIIYYTVGYDPNIFKLSINTLAVTKTKLDTIKPVTRIEIEVCPTAPEVIYALAGRGFLPQAGGVPTDSARYNGLFYSNNAGASFSVRNNNLNIFGDVNEQSFYDIAMCINPTNESEIVFGGVALFKSTDGGVNNIQLNNNNPLHADCHGLTYQTGLGRLYVCTDGGVSYSDNFGSTWSGFIGGIINNEVYRLSISQTANLLVCGTQDNGQFVRNSNTSVYHGMVLGFDGMDNFIDFSNNNIIYACTQNGSMVKSTNGGNSYDWITSIPDKGPWITAIVQSPSVANTIYYGGKMGVYRSTNGGDTWANIGGAGNAVALVANNDGSGDILYGISGNTIIRCDNPLATNPTWVSVGSPLSAPPKALAVNPANNSEVWIACGGYSNFDKLARSMNKGNTWTDLTLGLPGIPIYSLAFANNNNSPTGAIYIGTELGIFYGDDSTPDWNPFYNYLPMVPVTDLAVNYGNGEVTAATFGRGIWRSEKYTNCETSLNLFNVLYGKRFYQASDAIFTSQTMNSNAGNELRLRAGTRILLEAGFTIKEGAYFKGVIGNCGTGVP